jgi:hypothetical protein
MKEREGEQQIIDDLKIEKGYPKILSNYCKMDINEYTYIIRKLFGVKKRNRMKQLSKE